MPGVTKRVTVYKSHPKIMIIRTIQQNLGQIMNFKKSFKNYNKLRNYAKCARFCYF